MRTLTCILVVGTMLLGAAAALAEDVQTVEAHGEAAILDNDRSAAREKAIDDAKRNAVEQAVGTQVSSETVTENYQLISDRILSQAEGYIRKFKFTKDAAEGNVFIVEIEAEVAVGKVSSDLEGLKNLMRRKNMPKIILMIAEQNIGMDRAEYWWGPNGITSQDLHMVEHAVTEKMQEKGFTFFDPDVLAGKKTIKMPVAKLSEVQARKVAKLSDAQVVIFGYAVAQELGKTIDEPDMRLISSRAEVNAKAVNCDNGDIIATATADAVVPNISAKAAGSQALKKAGMVLADKLIEQIAKKWTEETSGTQSVRMTISGVTNKTLAKLITALEGQLRSVKAVHQRSLSKGTAVLDVQVAGDTKYLASELEAKDLGGIKIEVDEIKPNAITLKVLP